MKRKISLSIFFILFTTNICGQAIIDTQYGQDANTENLSDADKNTADTFVHNEKAQRIYEEECTANSETEEACLGSTADPKFMGMKSSMVSALAKAYVMIMGTAGGDLTRIVDVKKTPAEGSQSSEADSKTASTEDSTKEAETKEEKQTDYCKYIPMATEAISMVNTTTEQSTISALPSSEATQQRDTLLKAAANHESRAKTAKIQTTGWGVGTACYIGMMASPLASATSTGNILKLGASALLTSFYMKQIGAHEDYANKTKAIADKMPGEGDCNPITDKLCFCTEESSKTRADYQQYCQPTMGTQTIATTSERITCVNDKAEDDPSCLCTQTDTCIKKTVMTTISGFDGKSLMSTPVISSFESLASGELTSGSLTSAQTSLNSALAKLRELDKKIELEPNVILTAGQKAEAKMLQDMGMPANFATKVAMTPVSAASTKSAAKFNGSVNGTKRNYSNSRSSKKKSNVLTFSGGSGINSNAKKNTNKKPDFLSRFGLKKKKTKKNNQAVLKFAQQAENQAQISRNSERKIFDIISRRYQVSGWKRLDLVK